jgi:hypothetical protein
MEGISSMTDATESIHDPFVDIAVIGDHVLSPSTIDGLKQRLLAVHVEGIARIVDVEARAGTLVVSSEHVEGQSLTEMRAARGELPVELAVAIVARVCDRLAALHSAGFVHGALTADRVIVRQDAAGGVDVALTGLGVAWALDDPVVRRASAPVANLEYAAPELAGGQSPRAPADVYAAGVILYRLLAPLDDAQPGAATDVVDRAGGLARVRPPEVPDWLWTALASLLARRPNERSTASHAARRLRREPLGPFVPVTAAIPQRTRGSGRADAQRRARLGYAGLAVAAVMLVLVVALIAAAWPDDSVGAVTERTNHGSYQVERTWRLDRSGHLHATVRLTNTTAAPLGRVVHDEVLPPELDGRSVRFDPSPDELVQSPVGAARYSLEGLAPGAAMTIRYRGVVGSADSNTLERLRQSRFSAEETFVAQPARPFPTTSTTAAPTTTTIAPVGVRVPNIVGLNREQAEAAVRDAGFDAVILPGRSNANGVPAGVVYAAAPDPGSLVTMGAPVYLLVNDEAFCSTAAGTTYESCRDGFSLP